MELSHSRIPHRLIFRITAPLVITMLILGACLYLFNLRLISDFGRSQIAGSLAGFSYGIKEICDRRFTDLLHRGLLTDEKAVRIGKAETIGQIEDFMRKSQIGGRISTKDGSELLTYKISGQLLQNIAAEKSLRPMMAISNAGQDYYLTTIDFEPWAWHITVLKDAGQFASLKKSVRSVYFITAMVVMFATLLLAFSLNRVAQSPVAKIIADIRRGCTPQYKGIAEFEFLSDNIGQMMTALKESEQTLRNIADGLGEGVYVVDASGRLLFLNLEAERLLGWKEEELLGRPAHSIFHCHEAGPASTAVEACPVLDVIRTGKAFRSEEDIFRCRDGSTLPVAYVATPLKKEGVITGAVTAFQNITTRKRAEEERVRLATAIEQAAEVVLISDRQMIIQYVNPAFERLSGYARDEIIGRPSTVLHSDRHSPGFYDKISQTLARGEVWSGRLVNHNKDGSSYEAEVTVSPVRDKTDTIINYVHIHRDITQEVRLEKELRKAQKMEAIGTLAGGIAHDFNNILTAIMGYTQLALCKAADGSPLRRDLQAVLESSQRAADVVRQILTISRRTEKDRMPMQLAPTVAEVLKLLRPSLPSFIEIQQEIAITDREDIVLADPTQIHQILMNLCTNAAHAMRTKGGILSVKLTAVEVDASLAARYPELKKGPYVCLKVSDTGHGMDAAVMERIFDPYFTTKAVGEGTGLGLAVVHGIVKSYGGTITVYSEPGWGASFNIFLPRIQAEIDLPAKSEKERVAGGSERIFFVDDEESLVDLGQQMLESLGYRVWTETSSLQALAILSARPQTFDLLITDMTMPELTGRDLAKKVLALRPDLPVILCTGFSELINEKKAAEMGIRAFIMKPYVIGQLARTIRMALEPKSTVQTQQTQQS